MKKLSVYLAALTICLIGGLGIVGAFAGMDDVTFSASVIGARIETNKVVLRGKIESMYLTVPTAFVNTGSVVVTTADSIIYSNDVTTSTIAYPRIKVQDVNGTDLSYYGLPATIDGTATTTCSVKYVYEKYPVAGEVTVKFKGTHAVYTNAYTLKIVYDK